MKFGAWCFHSRARRWYVFIHAHRLLGGETPVELLGLKEAGGAEAVARGGIGGQKREFVREAEDILGLDQGGSLGQHLAEGAPSRGDHWTTAGHRLDGRQAEAFVERRINENLGGAVEIGEIILRHKTEATDVHGRGRPADGGMNGVGAVPVTPCQGELPFRARRDLKLLEGGDQADMIFCRMFEASDVKEERMTQAVALRNLQFGLAGRGWRKASVINAIMDDGKPVVLQAVEVGQVESGGLTHSDDVV